MSLEGVESHRAFAESLKLNFPLVADSTKVVATAFGTTRLWGILPFAKRVTFVVDAEGVVRRVIQSEFDIEGHVGGAIEALRAMSPG